MPLPVISSSEPEGIVERERGHITRAQSCVGETGQDVCVEQPVAEQVPFDAGDEERRSHAGLVGKPAHRLDNPPVRDAADTRPTPDTGIREGRESNTTSTSFFAIIRNAMGYVFAVGVCLPLVRAPRLRHRLYGYRAM